MEIETAKRLEHFQTGIFKTLNERKEALAASGRMVYNLSVGTPDFPVAPHVRQALIEAAEKPENFHYMLRDTPELLAAVKDYYKERFHVEISTDEITSVNGSQEGIAHIGMALCILDSGADHADLTDEYAAIPNECRAVAAVCGGEVLRDVPFETFLANIPACRKQCGDRAVLRAFHFYADNDRVPQQVAALREGDFDAFLQMVTASGDSSWEYLQNVIPAGYKEHQEVAVTIAAAKHYLGGKGAVRVHGGGFAGTVQAFVPVEMLADFKANMEKILGAGRCHVLSIRPEGGAVL